jgi:hypothetical protein
MRAGSPTITDTQPYAAGAAHAREVHHAKTTKPLPCQIDHSSTHRRLLTRGRLRSVSNYAHAPQDQDAPANQPEQEEARPERETH